MLQAKPVEPPQPRFIPRKERPKAIQAEPQPKAKAAVQAKQKATAANQPAKRPVAFESKQTGDAAAADRKGAFQRARNATQAVM